MRATANREDGNYKEAGFITHIADCGSVTVMTNKMSIAMLGYNFMGKAHTNAYRTMSYMVYPLPFDIELTAICGRNAEKVEAARGRFGFKRAVTDWRDLVEDQSIQVVDNSANDDAHYAPSVAALKAGKHVVVEKPMSLTLNEAVQMYEAAKAAERHGVKHMVGFNYRFAPAIRLARKLIKEGKLGEISHVRSSFLLDRISDPKAPFLLYLKSDNPSTSVLGRLNSHPIDMVRFLLGAEIDCVMAWSPKLKLAAEGGGKALEATSMLWLTTTCGASASLEASVAATGHKTDWSIEVFGSKGSVAFDLSRGNELRFFDATDPLYIQGPRTIHVSEPEAHDFASFWWPKGHNLGWEHYHIHMLAHFLQCIHNNTDVGPWGATFEDGLRCQQVIEAASEANTSGKWAKTRI